MRATPLTPKNRGSGLTSGPTRNQLCTAPSHNANQTPEAANTPHTPLCKRSHQCNAVVAPNVASTALNPKLRATSAQHKISGACHGTHTTTTGNSRGGEGRLGPNLPRHAAVVTGVRVQLLVVRAETSIASLLHDNNTTVNSMNNNKPPPPTFHIPTCRGQTQSPRLAERRQRAHRNPEWLLPAQCLQVLAP